MSDTQLLIGSIMLAILGWIAHQWAKEPELQQLDRNEAMRLEFVAGFIALMAWLMAGTGVIMLLFN